MSGSGREDIMASAARQAQEAARRAQARNLPRRFYKEATVAATQGGHGVLLDGRPLRTPLRRALVLPSRRLAEAVAAEWQAQQEHIDPARMPLTGLCNAAIDKAASEERAALLDHLRELAAHELLCYRAEEASQPELARQQRAEWDPLLAWARESLGARLRVAAGIMPVMQAQEAVSALLAPFEQACPFVFTALFSMATLCRSPLLALAVWRGRLTGQEAWRLATLEERWNMRHWGEDAEAAARLARQEADFLAAARMLALLGDR